MLAASDLVIAPFTLVFDTRLVDDVHASFTANFDHSFGASADRCACRRR